MSHVITSYNLNMSNRQFQVKFALSLTMSVKNTQKLDNITPFIGNWTGNFLVQVIVTDYCAVIKKFTSCQV